MYIADGHIICFSWTVEDHRESLTGFLRAGLKSRAAVTVLSHAQDVPAILEDLRRESPDLDRRISAHQITLGSARETLVERCDMLDAEKTLAWIGQQQTDAMARGYASYWLSMELTWVLEHPDGVALLTRLETRLEDIAKARRAVICCRYDLHRLDTGRLTTVVRAAKRVELGGEVIDNPYFTRGDALLGSQGERTLFNQMMETIASKGERDTLLDNEDLLRALFREIDVGFVLFEALDVGDEVLDFIAVQANPVLEEINGLSLGGAAGKNAAELFPVQDVEIREILSEVTLMGTSARFERFKPDTRRAYEVIAFRPKADLCAALVTDITERKRLEELKQRGEFRIRQTQKMEAIGRLASGVAHDFNNMLTAITALSNVLLEDIPDGSPQWRDVDEIRKAAERAASLTRQLLAFSRKQEIAPKVLNLNRTIESSHRLLSRIIGEDVHLVFRAEEPLRPVRFDPNQIEQILANFATNARDAMPKGGELVIQTEDVEVEAPIITAHGEVSPGSYVCLRVTDNGIGMSEEVLDRIFEPFYTTKERTKGTGLGLATVYGIVRQNDGTILVRSTPGEGTAFEIYLPPATSEIPTFRAATPSRCPSGSGTILLAEDEETVRNLTRRVLERSGYEVISAASGEEALLLFESEGFRVDLLLTDMVMPGMNGVELAGAIHLKKPALPILYMSGYPENVIREHGMQLEPDTFIEKPFSPEKLATRVQRLLM